MWKWIVGIVVALCLLVLVGGWWGYQAVQKNLSPDGTERVTIAGTPTRVFAALANGDSVPKWMANGNMVTSTRHGPLAVGDSLQVAMKSGFGMAQRPMTWQITEVNPDHLLAFELLSDSTHRVIAIRRDSLVAAGDSTNIISTVASPLVDSIQAAGAKPRPQTRDAIVGLSSTIIISAFRMQSKLDLLQLKGHIENRKVTLKR
ncbi:MAG: SRPBCC family protein [Thermoanaerobaculia bacterium]